MNTISSFLSSHEAIILAKALLHSLWQGAALAIVLYILLRKIPSRSADMRYRIAYTSLILLILFFVGTISILRIYPLLPAPMSSPAKAIGDTAQIPISPPPQPVIITGQVKQFPLDQAIPISWKDG